MGKGNDYSNGGIIDVGDNVAAGLDLGAKAAGLYFGGPAGASIASMGSKMVFGSDSDGSSTLGKINKGADALTMVSGVAGGAKDLFSAGSEPLKDAGSKGFSGITSSGKGVDSGGTNAFGNALGEGKGNSINKAITSSGNAMDKLNKAIEMKDQLGALLGNSQQNPNPQILIQPNNEITPQMPIQPMPQLNQVIAAQLMNPAQNRLAFRRFV